MFRALFFFLLAISASVIVGGEAPAPLPKTPDAPANPATATLPPPAIKTEKEEPPEDMSAPARYEDVVRDLMHQLLGESKNPRDSASEKYGNIKRENQESASDKEQRELVTTQDAARKLASLGWRSVPALSELFRASYDKPVTVKGAANASYYSAWALARIRTAEAGIALLPALTNPSTRSELRLLAIDAAGLEKSPEGVRALQKIAVSDPDLELRKKAFGQLTMMPEHWPKSEAIFLKALSDPDGEIRTLAAKACHFSHIFQSANDKLTEMIEGDPVTAVRILAMLTMGRMKYKTAQPALIRVLEADTSDEKVRKVALSSLSQIAEIPFTKKENALAWWKRDGEVKFTEAARRELNVKEQLKNLEETEKREAREAIAKIRAGEKSGAGASAPETPREPGLLLPPLSQPSTSSKPIMLAKPAAEEPGYAPLKIDQPEKPKILFDLLPDEEKRPAIAPPPPAKKPAPPEPITVDKSPVVIAPRPEPLKPARATATKESESTGAQRRRLRASE